ncbi:PhzF family phenazine biosynthesis protein [Lysinibacillus sphaericus]|uniref:Phenazine biosynthesis protein PhzF family protein n=1 Tax=Lysinibacillus sphaericus OT4b.31 TaxID=1285586 RepID=R7Z8D2_LYSSH|nr:phenazine biosynthesis protein PhzF family protein [Lysinibacillus sphaericus OT4b.31]
MNKVSYFIVNSFTTELYKGNPAAVCLLDATIPELTMQKIAQEIPVPTTAFIQKKDHVFFLRWFTPVMEIPICGHGTIASAFLLWQQGVIPVDRSITFQTISGPLQASWNNEMVEITIKKYPLEEIECPSELEDWLGTKPIYVGKTDLDYIVELSHEEYIAEFEPDFTAMNHFPVRGVCITSRSKNEGIDIVSRFFSPAQGIDEDHVNGSSHGALGPYWCEKLSKERIVSKQLSKRGGVLFVTPKVNDVAIAGPAVQILRGELLI